MRSGNMKSNYYLIKNWDGKWKINNLFPKYLKKDSNKCILNNFVHYIKNNANFHSL